MGSLSNWVDKLNFFLYKNEISRIQVLKQNIKNKEIIDETHARYDGTFSPISHCPNGEEYF